MLKRFIVQYLLHISTDFQSVGGTWRILGFEEAEIALYPPPALCTPSTSLGKDVIEIIGLVEEGFPNATFRVRILSAQARDHELLCHLAGRMRVHRVRILPGDRVKVEMTPYDLEKGRIVYRYRSDQPIPELGETLAPSPPPRP